MRACRILATSWLLAYRRLLRRRVLFLRRLRGPAPPEGGGAKVRLEGGKGGVSVRDLRKQGQGYRISGRKQRTGAAWPESGCINVKVSKKIAAAAYPALRAAIPSPEEVRKRGMTAAARILNMNRKKQKYKFGKPKSDAKKAKAAKRKASKAARHKSRKSR